MRIRNNRRMRPTRGLGLRAAGLFIALAWTEPRLARAEDSLAYKYQEYRERDGRVKVRTQTGHLEADLGVDWRLKLDGVIDAIAGATPTGQTASTPGGQVPLTQIEERRKAWSVDAARQFSRVNVAVGFANSRESDYVSNGWSLNTLITFNQKNTTLLLGYAGTDDDVKVFYQAANRQKRSMDLIVGITQLLDPSTSVTFNVTRGETAGYLSDPYKLVQQSVEVLPEVFLTRTFTENRPESRTKWIALASINRTFAAVNGAIEASYRYYRDDFGVTAQTVTAEWFQKIGAHVILRPGVRLYRQSQAEFYYYSLAGLPIIPSTRPTGKAPFYSSDYRLAALDTVNFGLKGIWLINDHWQIDAAVERYEMRGRDGITPASAFPTASIVTVGATFNF
jgi:hypothetical protein